MIPFRQTLQAGDSKTLIVSQPPTGPGGPNKIIAALPDQCAVVFTVDPSSPKQKLNVR